MINSTSKETNKKNILQPVVFEFDPKAKLERKGKILYKRPFSASSALINQKNNYYSNEKTEKTQKKPIEFNELSNQSYKKGKKTGTRNQNEFKPSFKKLKTNPNFTAKHKKILYDQQKWITKESLTKKKNENISNNKTCSNFEDSIFKGQTQDVDFQTILNKFIESDENITNKKHQKAPKLNPLTNSVELFIENFEKNAPIKIPFKEFPPKKLSVVSMKANEIANKDLEDKNACEIFQHFKTKFKISEILNKNLQQISELKKNFKALKEEQPPLNNNYIKENEEAKNEMKSIQQIKTKEVNNEDSFHEIKSEQVYEYQAQKNEKVLHSSVANVIFFHFLPFIYFNIANETVI